MDPQLDLQLSSLEAAAVSRSDYATAGRIKESRDRLRDLVAALGATKERVDAAAAVRNYQEAAETEQERINLEGSLQSEIKNIKAEFGSQLDAAQPSIAVATGTPVPQPIAQPMPVAQPIAQPMPVAQPLQSANVNPSITVSVRRGGALNTPLISQEGPVVQGIRAPPGGTWTTESYIGPTTFCMAFCLSPLAVVCPCDTRSVYIAPNGTHYRTVGNGWRNALIVFWCLSSIAIVFLVVTMQAAVANAESGGGGGGCTDPTYCSDDSDCCSDTCYLYDNTCSSY